MEPVTKHGGRTRAEGTQSAAPRRAVLSSVRTGPGLLDEREGLSDLVSLFAIYRRLMGLASNYSNL